MTDTVKIKIIQPKKITAAAHNKVIEKKKVAAYARVSTDSAEQLTSYEAQVRHYTKYIQEHDNWVFVNVYTDEGISGTSIKHREGFKQMINDAMNGKIDLIITKSVSRFARNTVDTLTNVRALKDKNVEVYFEEQNIHSLDPTGETFLTIMSSLAQEESRSISENVKWGIQKKHENGSYSVPFKRFLGYQRGPHGELVIDETEAPIVKEIYSLYLEGMGTTKIAQRLSDENRKTPTGNNSKWDPGTVRAILTNEKYKGDALLEKYYTEDYLTKKIVVNKVKPQYYIIDSHPAIIDPDAWDLVQRIMKDRDELRYRGTHALSGKIVCNECNCFYTSVQLHSGSPYYTMAWRCQNKYGKADHHCSTPTIRDDILKQMAIMALQYLYSKKQSVLSSYERKNSSEQSIIALQTKEAQIRLKLAENGKLYCAAPPDKQDEIALQREKLIESLYITLETLQNTRANDAAMKTFIETLKSMDKKPDEFDSTLFRNTIDCVIVQSADKVLVKYMNGTKKEFPLQKHQYIRKPKCK